MARSVEAERSDDELRRELSSTERAVHDAEEALHDRERFVAAGLRPLSRALEQEHQRTVRRLDDEVRARAATERRLHAGEEAVARRDQELALLRARIERWKASPDRERREHLRLRWRILVDRSALIGSTSLFATGLYWLWHDASTTAGAVVSVGAGACVWLVMGWTWLRRGRWTG